MGKVDTFLRNRMNLYEKMREKLHEKLHERVARKSYTNEMHGKVTWNKV